MTVTQDTKTISIPAGAMPLESVDLSDPSGTVRKGDGVYVREYSGNVHPLIFKGFDPAMRWLLALEVAYDNTGRLTVCAIRFRIADQLRRGRPIRYEIDRGDGFHEVRFMVSEIWHVGPVILNDPRKRGETP